MVAGLSLAAEEPAATRGSESQSREKIGGDCCTVNALWLTRAGQIHIACAIRGKLFERLALGLPVQVVGCGHWALLPGRHSHKAMQIGQSKRPHQEGFGETEDGGVHADPQRQSKQRGHCEARVFAEHANAVTNVLQKRVKEGKTALVAIKILGLLEAAEFDQSLTARFDSVHARAQIVLDVHLEMAFHLRGEIPVATVPAEESAKSYKPSTQL